MLFHNLIFLLTSQNGLEIKPLYIYSSKLIAQECVLTLNDHHFHCDFTMFLISLVGNSNKFQKSRWNSRIIACVCVCGVDFR